MNSNMSMIQVQPTAESTTSLYDFRMFLTGESRVIVTRVENMFYKNIAEGSFLAFIAVALISPVLCIRWITCICLLDRFFPPYC